jgi:GAF domain-containing protein
MRLLSELVPCEATSACLYDINTDEFRFVTLSGPGAEARQGEAVPNNTGLFGVAAHRVGQVLNVEDATQDERFDPGVDGRVGLEARSLLYMPLNHQGQLFGMVQLINRDNRPAFTTADGDVTAYVGKQLGEFLQQARMSVDNLRRQSG